MTWVCRAPSKARIMKKEYWGDSRVSRKWSFKLHSSLMAEASLRGIPLCCEACFLSVVEIIWASIPRYDPFFRWFGLAGTTEKAVWYVHLGCSLSMHTIGSLPGQWYFFIPTKDILDQIYSPNNLQDVSCKVRGNMNLEILIKESTINTPSASFFPCLFLLIYFFFVLKASKSFNKIGQNTFIWVELRVVTDTGHILLIWDGYSTDQPQGVWLGFSPSKKTSWGFKLFVISCCALWGT